MISKQQVSSLAREKSVSMNCFIVDIKVSSSNDITIVLDKNEGLDMSDCLQMSRYIERNLDREIEDYNLSVSSPGAFSPFLVQEQYCKNINEMISVKLVNGIKYSGIMRGYDEVLKLEMIKKKRGKLIDIKKDEIKEVKRKINFK